MGALVTTASIFARRVAARAGVSAAVHMDVFPQMERGKVVHVAGRAFLTLLDLERRSACVDAPIPSAPETMPVLTIRGQQLFVLEQVVADGPRPDARAFVRTYQVDPSSCSWLPVP